MALNTVVIVDMPLFFLDKELKMVCNFHEKEIVVVDYT